MATKPLLRHPDFTQTFFLDCDASLDGGFGSVLNQKDAFTGLDHAIAYASTPLPLSLKNSPASYIEAAAACWAMQYFRHYLLHRQFVLRTDNRIMKYLKARSEVVGVLARYIVESQEFDFVVKHVPGKRHTAADFFSRVSARTSEPDTRTFEHMERMYMPVRSSPLQSVQGAEAPALSPLLSKGLVPTDASSDAAPPCDPPLLSPELWKLEQQKDVKIQKLRALLEDPASPTQGFFMLYNGLVSYQREGQAPRVYVPSSMRSLLMENIHDHFGHRGTNVIIQILARHVYWPKMSQYVRHYIRACIDCKRRKTPRPFRAGLTGTVHASKPLHRMHLDFPGGSLPPTLEGYLYALIIIDGFSRYPWIIPLKTKTSSEIAEALIREVFSVFGLPDIVHSDNEPTLVSECLREVFRRLNVKRTMSAVRHPQGNAPCERFIRYFNTAIALMLTSYDNWAAAIPLILFPYRVLQQATTGYSPYFLMFGRAAALPLTFSFSETYETVQYSTTDDYANQMIEHLRQAFLTVRRRQEMASLANAERRDENRFQVKYQEGDPVFYHEPSASSATGSSVRPAILIRERGKVGKKYQFPWSGPHMINRQVSPNSYEIYHTDRRQLVIANVDSLDLYHPFSPIEVPLTESAVNTAEARTDKMHEAEDIRLLQTGDLCITYRREADFEPLSVVKFIKPLEDGNVLVQWYGNTSLLWYIDVRMLKQKWHPGWYDPKDRKFYFSSSKMYHNHPTFTNELSQEIIKMENIILFGFNLNPNLKLPREVANRALEIRRQHPSSLPKGPRTTEELGAIDATGTPL